MTVKVHLKDGSAFEYKETAIFDDAEAGWLSLSYGALKGNRTNLPGRLSRHYMYDEINHIVYSWRDIQKVEVTP